MDEPEWWDKELDVVHDEPDIRIGTQEAIGVDVHQIGRVEGYAITFYARGSGQVVWCPTTSDYLDLMTARVPSWCGLQVPRTTDL
jgi:hypothetical protein